MVPKLHKSKILAPGMHWEMRPVSARLTILDASWYLVQTSLYMRVDDEMKRQRVEVGVRVC